MSDKLKVVALKDLRLGVEMDRHNLPDADVKLAALDAAIATLSRQDAYTAPPAQVDLEQFREAVAHWKRDLHDDYTHGHINDGGEAMREAEHLIALIDQQAGKGASNG